MLHVCNKLPFNSIQQVHNAFATKDIIVAELFDLCYNIAKQSEHNEFITLLDRDDVNNRIVESQRRVDSGEMRPLEGVPIAVKDNFCTKGVKSTAGSRILSNFVPSYESEVTARLLNAGCIMIGKTNMDEFGMGSSTIYGAFGACTSPYPNPMTGEYNLTPGGSSGGSAVSVAMGSSLLSLGTDTGGSVRQPAAFCGLYGIKPTYGLISRYGIMAFSSSFDQAGLLANTPGDLALSLGQVCGVDEKDSTTASTSVCNMLNADKKSEFRIGDLRIAVLCDSLLDGVDPDILAAINDVCGKLESAGVRRCHDIEMEYFGFAAQIYHTVAISECFSNLARFDGIRYGSSRGVSGIKDLHDFYIENRTNGFGEEVRRRMSVGASVLSSDNYETHFVQAAKVRNLLVREFQQVFDNIDLIIMPTTADFPVNPYGDSDLVEIYSADRFVLPPSCCGLPGLSIPCGFNKDGLPIGIQLVGRWFSDSMLLQVADFLR